MAAWLAVDLVGSCELLMMVIRSSQMFPDGMHSKVEIRDPLQEQVAEVFVGRLHGAWRASERAIKEFYVMFETGQDSGAEGQARAPVQLRHVGHFATTQDDRRIRSPAAAGGHGSSASWSTV